MVTSVFLSAAAYWLWLLFLATWWLAALRTDRAVSRGALAQWLLYFAGWGLGFALLFALPPMAIQPHRLAGIGALMPPSWRVPLWRNPMWLTALWFVGELAAFAFAWWARVHLGRLWSGMLTLREGHRVVDTGPYGLVRHPIYTGFIAAAWMLALIMPAPPVLAGALVLTIVMTVKARTEERLLARELGPESYAAYKRRVPMLVPFLVRGRTPPA